MTQPKHASTIKLNHFDKTRVYQIGDQQLPSVTSIIKFMDKPALVSWAGKMAAEFAADNMDALKLLDREDQILLIKNGWRKSLNRSANFGTAVHKMIEDGIYPDPGERAFGYVNQAEQMLSDWNLEVAAQEVTLVNPAAGYAGTVDAITYNDLGDLSYADWKTGKGTYIDSHGMQLTALMECTHIVTNGNLEALTETPAEGLCVRLGENSYNVKGITNGSDTHQALYAAFIGLIDTWKLKKLNPEWDTK